MGVSIHALKNCYCELKSSVEDLLNQPAPIVPVACDADPIPDNRADDDVRVGESGVSEEFARCDHKHEIKRQENTGWPVITFFGPATEIPITFGDRRFRSDEESVYYTQTRRYTLTTQSGWFRILLPNKVGFQPPIFRPKGELWSTGQDNQQVNPSHAQNTALNYVDNGQVYYGQVSGKDTEVTITINFELQYIRL